MTKLALVTLLLSVSGVARAQQANFNVDDSSNVTTYRTVSSDFLKGVCEQQANSNADDSPNVKIYGTGPSHAYLNEIVAHALGSRQVQDFLNGTRHRVLASEFVSEPLGMYSDVKASEDFFRTTVYDYTHGRTILVHGRPFDMSAIFVTESGAQPIPSTEELADAAAIAGARQNEIVRGSMPPVIGLRYPGGTEERVLNIAINSQNSSKIVYVNMNRRNIFADWFRNKPLTCDAPRSASGSPTDQGVPGTANLVISQGAKQLWTFQVVRPSASSGLRGSGIELRNVKYKGKTVLFRAHVPINNVEYEPAVPWGRDPVCGPHYRDWQYSEFYLRCEGTDIAPGFRLCNSPAKTILDSPYIDGGDFRGVAVYVDGQEVVLKAQLMVGWHRYVSEWRFHVNGVLKPRWGFGGVLEGIGCICKTHHHHVYWRFDFDIVTAGNNLVKEFNDPSIVFNSNYHDHIFETTTWKDARRKTHWEISNTWSGDSYALLPGSNDGTTWIGYGVGDLWVLRYHSDELDDGVQKSVVNGTAEQTTAHLDKFVNGEPVNDKDVVVWYAAHFKHDQNHDGGGDQIVGPEIRPLKW